MASIGADSLGLQTPNAVFEQVLLSRTVQDHLIDQFDLRKVYHTPMYRDARAKLAEHTQVGDDRKSGIITITVSASSPAMAAALTKGYVDELNTMMVQLDTSAAHRERVFVEDRLKEVQADLNRDSVLLSEFASKNTTIDLAEQGKAMMTAADVLHGQAIAAQSELAGLRQIYSADNSRVRAAQAKVDELERQLEKIRGSGEKDAGDVDGYPSIRKLPQLGVQYADLYRNLKVQEMVFQTLTNQFEIAKIQEARDLPSVRVLDPADIPEWKSWPRRSVFALTGAVLAFVFACIYIVGRKWWQETTGRSPFKQFLLEVLSTSREDLSRIPGLRGLGTDLTAQKVSGYGGGQDC